MRPPYASVQAVPTLRLQRHGRRRSQHSKSAVHMAARARAFRSVCHADAQLCWGLRGWTTSSAAVRRPALHQAHARAFAKRAAKRKTGKTRVVYIPLEAASVTRVATLFKSSAEDVLQVRPHPA